MLVVPAADDADPGAAPLHQLNVRRRTCRIIGGRVFGTNSYIGLWLAHTAYGLPFAVFLLRNFFGALPRDLFESAYLDGASDSRSSGEIVLPLSMPAIAALAIFQFLWVWNDLLIALVFLGDPTCSR